MGLSLAARGFAIASICFVATQRAAALDASGKWFLLSDGSVVTQKRADDAKHHLQQWRTLMLEEGTLESPCIVEDDTILKWFNDRTCIPFSSFSYVNEELIGGIAACQISNQLIEIKRINVVNSRQRLGLASNLVNQITDIAKAKKIKLNEIHTTIWAANASSINFFGSCGFLPMSSNGRQFIDCPSAAMVGNACGILMTKSTLHRNKVLSQFITHTHQLDNRFKQEITNARKELSSIDPKGVLSNEAEFLNNPDDFFKLVVVPFDTVPMTTIDKFWNALHEQWSFFTSVPIEGAKSLPGNSVFCNALIVGDTMLGLGCLNKNYFEDTKQRLFMCLLRHNAPGFGSVWPLHVWTRLHAATMKQSIKQRTDVGSHVLGMISNDNISNIYGALSHDCTIGNQRFWGPAEDEKLKQKLSFSLISCPVKTVDDVHFKARMEHDYADWRISAVKASVGEAKKRLS